MTNSQSTTTLSNERVIQMRLQNKMKILEDFKKAQQIGKGLTKPPLNKNHQSLQKSLSIKNCKKAISSSARKKVTYSLVNPKLNRCGSANHLSKPSSSNLKPQSSAQSEIRKLKKMLVLITFLFLFLMYFILFVCFRSEQEKNIIFATKDYTLKRPTRPILNIKTVNFSPERTQRKKKIKKSQLTILQQNIIDAARKNNFLYVIFIIHSCNYGG